MTIRYREITAQDVSDLFIVRTATHQNRMTLEELHALDITEATVKEKLKGTYQGWLCEVDDRIIGFAMGDRATGELWVIAVLPEYIGMGIGSRLLREVEQWLAENGCERLWLTTDIDPTLKAYDFYRSHGWEDDRMEGGIRFMRKVISP